MATDTPRGEAGPETRFQCAACGKWPQFRNWPNHMLAYPSHRAIFEAEAVAGPRDEGLREAAKQALDYFETSAGDYYRLYGHNDEPTDRLRAALAKADADR